VKQEWEYKLVRSFILKVGSAFSGAKSENIDPEEAMNAAAEEGWEFMQAIAYATSEGAVTVNHYFRRQVPDRGLAREAPSSESGGDPTDPASH
jgi:uncharacterized protein DUF4177